MEGETKELAMISEQKNKMAMHASGDEVRKKNGAFFEFKSIISQGLHIACESVFFLCFFFSYS